ncbi:class II aldolase/adducin family protein [Streptomyces sp. Act-28]
MRDHFGESGLTVRQKLALTCRVLFDGGHDSGLVGQITARGQEPGTYCTQRLGLGFDEIAEDNLLLVDEDLDVLEGPGPPSLPPGAKYLSVMLRPWGR